MIDWILLLTALIAVESEGNPGAVGDNGLAFGILQLHSAYVQDAAEWSGENWTHEDAFDPFKAVEIFAAYVERYCGNSRRPKGMSREEFIARTHNGGPRGAYKDSTLPYWEKVKKEFDN
jgi:soluble lytic murein transglycosylase-like protein|tara:strand:+ start:2475 stop:2831 length:357 start_codon:yes stop_codon:yes gene_type:complete